MTPNRRFQSGGFLLYRTLLVSVKRNRFVCPLSLPLCNHKENCGLAPRAKQDNDMMVLKAMRNVRKARLLVFIYQV